jgi:hypothetical protein
VKKENSEVAMGWSTYINVPKQDEEVIHNLWSTPVIMSKPFGIEFIARLKQDVKYLLVNNGPGTLNQTDLWTLPDLPETMVIVKEKMMEMAEKAFRPHCEMPLPPFRVAKGYFRETKPNSPYRITPHRHANVYGVGVFYIDVKETNPGNLTFMDPRAGINWVNQFTAFKKVKVEEGLLIVHPGYLIHYVEPSNAEMGMYYDYRLALITNIHRTQDEWVNTLREKDEQLRRLASADF